MCSSRTGATQPRKVLVLRCIYSNTSLADSFTTDLADLADVLLRGLHNPRYKHAIQWLHARYRPSTLRDEPA